jgi:hypothetical protein
MKIKLHSVTDLVTNSSTPIYTFSEASEFAFKELVTEFFKTISLDKTCDEVFSVAVLPGEWYYHRDWLAKNGTEEVHKLLKELKYDGFDDLMRKIAMKEVPEPKWYKEVMKAVDTEDIRGGTTLNITAKDPKYEKLAELFKKFLYSTDSREVST